MVNISANAEQIPGVRKTAILLVMLGDEASSAILRELDQDEIEEVSREIARVQALTPEEAEGVLDEFHQMVTARDYVIKGGIEYARKVLINAFGEESAQRMLDRLMKSLGNESLSFDSLQKTDPQQLSKFIHSEHPQTIALILSHLNPSQAAALLSSLPKEIRGDVATRMASLDQISPDIISKIANVIGLKLRALGEMSRESYGGVDAVAEMLNRLDSTATKDILDIMEQANEGLANNIRHLMFVFEDLLLLDVNAIKEILAKIDRKILTIALKGTSEKMKTHILQAMSQRGADMMREDMDAMGPIKIKEVEAAQQQIIAVVRQLETEGVVSLKGATGEQYVV
jgi:flagellar motor switch protein FliG